MNNNNVVGNVAGRLPVYCGDWDPYWNGGEGYSEFNEVSYAGSTFISVMENNTNVPCVLVRDSRGNLLEYHLNSGWNFIANAMDSSIAMTELIYHSDTIEHNVSYMECNTGATEQIKVLYEKDFKLSTHVRLIVKMKYANKHSSPKLNVNGTGYKSIYYNSKPCDSTNTWEDDELVDIFYDGTKYCITSHEHSSGGEFVVLSEAEYEAIAEKDPKILYFTYEGGDSDVRVEGTLLITMDDIVRGSVVETLGTVVENIWTF